MIIRLAEDKDFEEIFEIWLSGISASFSDIPSDTNFLRNKFHKNFSLRQGIFNYWVAVNEEDDQILGWQSLSRTTLNPLKEELYAESSTYIKNNSKNMGVAGKLLQYVGDEAENSKLHYIIAFVSESNAAIRKLVKELNWMEVGQMPKSRSRSDNRISKIFIVKAL